MSFITFAHKSHSVKHEAPSWFSTPRNGTATA